MRRTSAAEQSTMFDLFDGTESAPPPKPVDVTKLEPAAAEAAIEAAEEEALAEQREELLEGAPPEIATAIGDAIVDRVDREIMALAPIAPMPAEAEHLEMFDLEPPWREHWRGMPEYANEDLTARHSVLVNFATDADLEAFAKLIGQTVLATTRSVWYPEAEIGHMVDKRYADGAPVFIERAPKAEVQLVQPSSAPAAAAIAPEFNDDIPF